MSGILNRFIPTPRYPLTTTAPYTYRDGMTFTQQIEVIRSILDELVKSDIAQTTAYNAIVDSVNVSITSTLEILGDLETSYTDKLAAMQGLLDGALLDLSNALDEVAGAVNAANAATASAQALSTSFQNTVNTYVTEMQALRDNVALQISQQNDFVEENLGNKVDVNSLLINVKDHGARGDGTGNDTPAIQAAINAGGFGARIYFPKGRYAMDAGITLLANQNMVGVSMNRRGLSNGSSNDDGAVLVANSAFTGTLITCEGGVSLENLRLDGPGYAGTTTAIAQITGSSFAARNLFIKNWAVGMHLKDAYYTHLEHITAWENGVAFHFEHCYNLSFFNPRISCIRQDSSIGTGVRMTNQSEVHIFGGAVEGYKHAFTMETAYQLLNLNNVYFEQGIADGYSIGVNVVGAANTVNAHGCLVWLNNHRSWIYFPANAGARLNAYGNYFKWANDPGTLGIYAYEWANPNTGALRVNLFGDNWERVPKVVNLKYSPSILPGASMVVPPYGAYRDGGVTDEIVLTTHRTLNVGLQTWTHLGKNVNTAYPSMPGGQEWAGAALWDVDLNKLVIWNGSQWVDSMGVPV